MLSIVSSVVLAGAFQKKQGGSQQQRSLHPSHTYLPLVAIMVPPADTSPVKQNIARHFRAEMGRTRAAPKAL